MIVNQGNISYKQDAKVQEMIDDLNEKKMKRIDFIMNNENL